MPLNLYATVNGFTTQEGTGDASPNNVRKIKNAGEFNKLMKINGDTSGLFMSSVVPTRVAVPVPDAIANQNPLCDLYASNRVSQTDKTCYIDSNKNFGITDSRFTSLDEAKRILSEHPVTFVYLSTENAGKFYTGIEITQGDEYRCEIIDLQAPLHAGDTLETNVQSEYDAYAEFDGSSDENWILESGGATGSSGSKWLWIKFSGPQIKNITTTEVPEAASNFLIADTSQNTYLAKSDNTFSLAYSSGNILQVRVAGIAIVESLKTHLQSHPLRVFYKSASTGAPKSIKREEYTRRSRVFTGTEAMTATTVSEKTYFAIPAPDAKRPNNTTDVLKTRSNMFSTASQVNIILDDYRVCVSVGGNLLIYFNTAIKTVEQAQQILSEKYAAGTPATIEYELAQPEVFADDPIDIPVTALEVVVNGEGESKVTYYIEPKYDKIKTDWKVQPPTPEGYYNGDWFELEDYVRIYNNLQTVKDLVKSIYGDFTFPTMVTPVEGSPVFASQINILEEAIRAIRNKSIAIPEIPDPKTWTDNANLFTYEDINRWESVAIYYTAILMGVYELQPKLQFKLGGAQF